MPVASPPRPSRTFARVCVSGVVLTLAAACGSPAPSAPTSPAPGTTSASVPSTSPTSASPPRPSPTTPSPAATSSGPRPTTTPTTRPTPSPTTTALPASLLGKDVRLVPTDRKLVVLTFDGGGNADGVAKILATLDAKHVPGTFFLTGHWAQTYPAKARAIVAAGHVVGNHTMTHPHVTTLSDAALTAQVLDAAAVLRTTTGVSPKPWFRFPYGERTLADITLLNGLGYVCVSWGVDTLGWLGTSRGTVDDVRKRVLAALQPGLIVLMHLGSNPDDGTTFDADALASTIDSVRARGYAFGTVEALR